MILTFMSNSLAATLGEHEEQSPPDNDLQREEYLSICPFNYYPSILFVHSTIIHPFYLSIQLLSIHFICPFNYYPSILFVHSTIIHPFYLSIQILSIHFICPFNYYPSILFVHSTIIHPFYLSIQHTLNVRYVFFSYHLVL